MAKKHDVFNTLAEKYNAPGSERLVKVLKAMVTPLEGKILLALWDPMTCEELAKNLNIDDNELQNMLEVMIRKGVIAPRKDIYATQQNLMFLCHRTVNMSAITDKLWTDFWYEDWRYILAEQNHNRRKGGTTTFHRILPALQALAASPHIPPGEIQWYENLDALLQRSKQIQFIRCVCRAQYHKCDNKVSLCMHVILKDDEAHEQAPPMERWGNLKKYTYQEALAELYAAEDAGMCHLSPNYRGLLDTCNCCECCCRVVQPLIYGGKDYDLMDPHKSRFQASINQELCSGCQTCVGRCMFNAIEMTKVPGSKKLKAQVMKKYCMGCGLCVYTCPEKAIRFDIVRPLAHIPDVTREQAMRGAPNPVY